ncbi:hypothetical protein ACFVUH_07885 [Kitasatospora sp. NPDC058032]|uniref:hypothetical protein n=1 Tax=Kitasatospora sp. NPDC058032 TaxID=3346307 RepID=UPI0036DE35FD
MRPSTVRRLVRTVPLAAVVAGAAGYALLPAESGAGAGPVRAVRPVPVEVLPAGAVATGPVPTGPVPTGVAPSGASMRSALAAPVAEGSAPVFAPVLVPAGYADGLPADATTVLTATPGPSSTPSATPSAPAGGALPKPGGSPVWPEVPPLAVGEQVDVAIRPLGGTWEARADGSYVDFEVTWTNTTPMRYDEVVPVVRVLPYDYPAAVARPGTTAKGMLDRKDLDEWREVKLDQVGVGTGPQQGTFALDPGERRTVRYRLTLASGGMAGRLPISAEGWIGRGARAVRVGGTEARLQVTVAQPVQLSVTRPTDAAMGRVPSEVRVELTNVDGFASHTVAPALAVPDPRTQATGQGPGPEALITEVLVDGEWRRLQATAGAGGPVPLDTAGLSRVLGPGESAVYRFRIAVPTGWLAWMGIDLTVGHSVDGQALPTRRAHVRLSS